MFSVTDQVITDWTEPILRGLITENASITDVFSFIFSLFFLILFLILSTCVFVWFRFGTSSHNKVVFLFFFSYSSLSSSIDNLENFADGDGSSFVS